MVTGLTGSCTGIVEETEKEEVGCPAESGTGVGIGVGIGGSDEGLVLRSLLEITPKAKAQDSTAHLAASSANPRLSCSFL
ncbi:MAG: hypothetical protein ACK5TF_06520, partial [bacterium]